VVISSTTVGEIVLLRVPAHVLKWQDGYGWLIGQRKSLGDGRLRVASGEPDTIDPHRSVNVLELLLTSIFEGSIKLALDVLLHPGGYADASRLGNGLQACCHVDPIAEDVRIVDDDVALVYAHPELNLLILGHLDIAFDHRALDLQSTVQGIHDARELDQHAVPCGLYDTAAVFANLGVNQGAPVSLELSQRTFLVRTHETTVSGHIGRQYGGQAPLYTLCGQGCTPG
jgi:hypothetical protein